MFPTWEGLQRDIVPDDGPRCNRIRVQRRHISRPATHLRADEPRLTGCDMGLFGAAESVSDQAHGWQSVGVFSGTLRGPRGARIPLGDDKSRERLLALDQTAFPSSMPAMRNAQRMLVDTAVLGLAFCVGCTAPARTGDPLAHTFATTDKGQCEWLWEASQSVLRENRFVLDRVDRRSGVISTHPETSQQFFEFWRHDVEVPYDSWEATLRTVRRSVRIDVDFDVEASASELTIAVRRERFATPERQFNNSIAAFRAFGNDLPGAQTGRPVSTADNYWINDGRDLEMERYLLEKIIARTGGEAR